MRIAYQMDEPFATLEDDGTRRGVVEITEGTKVVARIVVAIIEEESEPVKLHTVIAPTKDYGVEMAREETFSGDVAIAYSELVAAARDYLVRHAGRTTRAGSLTIDIED